MEKVSRRYWHSRYLLFKTPLYRRADTRARGLIFRKCFSLYGRLDVRTIGIYVWRRERREKERNGEIGEIAPLSRAT